MKNEFLIDRRQAIIALLNQVGAFEIKIIGNSMYPYIHNNQIVTVRSIKNDNDFLVGNVVLFQRNDILILHRIIDIYKNRAFVKGDNEQEIDLIKKSNIIGVYDNSINIVPFNLDYNFCGRYYKFVLTVENGVLTFIDFEGV